MFALPLSAPSAFADSAAPWRGTDIGQRMIGNTIVGTAHDLFGAEFMIYFHPDGIARGAAEKFGWMVIDTGRWDIDGDRICVRWTKWEGRERVCRSTVTRAGEILMVDADGTVTSRQVIREGNPYGL